MTAKERMVNRFDESMSGGWHGPSLYKLVENLGIEERARVVVMGDKGAANPCPLHKLPQLFNPPARD